MGYWGFESLEYRKPKYQNVTVSTSEPVHEPVSIEEAKNYLKVDYSTDDTLIENLIHVVRKQIENELGGLLIVKRAVTQRQTGGLETIALLRQPVNSITSVTYYESFESTGSVISSTDYRFSDGQLYHLNNWFDAGRESDGYVIVYNAGIADDTGQSAENSPHTLRHAILRIVAYLYENREEYVTQINEGNLSVTYDKKIRSDVNLLLMPYHTGQAVF
jgi:uncharacterized phiE125 gp8 family phage protein